MHFEARRREAAPIRAMAEEFRMAILLSWTSVGIGDLDVFIPSPPCLVVYTSYVDDQPESSVTYFWQDENTGMLSHQLLYMEPVPFQTALAWAQEHAPTRQIERIHVKHARVKKAPERKSVSKPTVKKGTAKRAAVKKGAVKRTAVKKAAPAGKRGVVKSRRKQSGKAV
jgi:hypothetical protein